MNKQLKIEYNNSSYFWNNNPIKYQSSSNINKSLPVKE